MTYDQYWYDDPLMVRAFYQAEKLRQDMEDERAWLHGAYVVEAIMSTVGNVFREKTAQPAEYPRQPYSALERQRKKADRDKQSGEVKADQEALFAKQYMLNMVRAGKNWGKKG